MDYLPLTPIDINHLRIFSNERDILRDLFVFLDYVYERKIKRMTRSNEIPRPDQQRIAKLLGIFDNNQVNNIVNYWIDFIDELAFHLHLVSYNIKGEYRGWNSSEPSFIENYIDVNKVVLQKFIELDPVEQEKKILNILNTLQTISSNNIGAYIEFFYTSVIGSLDTFSTYGSANGVVSTLNYSAIRQFLLEQLMKCETGIWYSTESLVQYLKTAYPYFLIPKIIPPDRYKKVNARYENFHESILAYDYNHSTTPTADEPDAFERVEGRYVERFLEFIPLIMRFVDVAYDTEPYTGLFPTQGMLKAFRVNDRLNRLMSSKTDLTRVTVQPNFDVVIEADFYPKRIIRQLAALGEQISMPSTSSAHVSIFQLKKGRVAAEQVRQPALNVIALLKELSGRDIPPNVEIEIEEWCGHANQFILYDGFALLESVYDIPNLEQFSVEQISPNMRLVRNAKKLLQNLEEKGFAPLHVEHSNKGFYSLSEDITSNFPHTTDIEEQKTITPLKIKRILSVTLQFPDRISFEAFRKELVELRCPFQSDTKISNITFDQNNLAKFEQVIQNLKDVYAVEME